MTATPAPPTEPTPFQRFRDMTRKLMAIPKAEIVAQEEKYKRAKARRAKKKTK
jgi:hypothetical protein